MHWVNRGPEPDGLAQIRSNLTICWVRRYQNRIGTKPADSRWRRFHGDLGGVFFGNSAYCEEISRGETDHFRPKSRFPELVYEWSNWVFSCHDCNNFKGEKWPAGGLVDPCVRSRLARPENYFSFDTLTGEVIPKDGITPARRNKARRMINDLRLNEVHHLRKRSQWLGMASRALVGLALDESDYDSGLVDVLANRNNELSSITRVWLSEQGYPV
jgi:uncharacterized protein (TIGR02646 family)